MIFRMIKYENFYGSKKMHEHLVKGNFIEKRDILMGSPTGKVSEPVRMSLRLLIGQEGDILPVQLALKVSESHRNVHLF